MIEKIAYKVLRLLWFKLLKVKWRILLYAFWKKFLKKQLEIMVERTDTKFDNMTFKAIDKLVENFIKPNNYFDESKVSKEKADIM